MLTMHTYQEKGSEGRKEKCLRGAPGDDGGLEDFRNKQKKKAESWRDDSSRLLPVLTAGEPNSAGTGDKEGLISSFNQDE